MNNEVYYKIYYYEPEDNVTVVCMQYFDEYDYIQENFFKDEDGEVLKFEWEYEAIQWLNDNVIEDKIDLKYKKGFNQSKFMKK